MRTFAAAAATLAITGAAVVAAQDPDPEETVRRQLRAVQQYWEGQGFGVTHEVQVDTLNDGGEKSITVLLKAGMSYEMSGGCDLDCDDLDLFLYDDRGQEVDRDDEVDDTPIVAVTPARGGEFRLRARMVTCDANPCSFGIAVFGKPR
jgi:hypothetical protein